MAARTPKRRTGTSTSSFGMGKREGHDSAAFYQRKLKEAVISKDVTENLAPQVDCLWGHSAEQMGELPDNCVALMVTSPPYHVGKDYDSEGTFDDYLGMLTRVFAETYRVLLPGGRAVVNIANLGRRPYLSLASHVYHLMEQLGYLARGEVIWVKAKGAAGNCAWGSWRSARNPTLRDVHEYCLCFSKGRFDRVSKGESTISAQDFMAATLSVWEIPAESARRVGHPAPFPVALPARFTELYTYKGDLVLDPFMGSGTTAIAALRLGRHFVGYETSAEYLAAAEQRIAKESLCVSGRMAMRPYGVSQCCFSVS
jgi:DNA modification methylase